jgi:hypothetical protein
MAYIIWRFRTPAKQWFSFSPFFLFLFLVGWDWVSWYCGHYWPIVPAPDDRWWWLWRNWSNEDWQGKPKYSEKTCPTATFSTTNSTWIDPGSNPGRRGGNPATHRLIYGAASYWLYCHDYTGCFMMTRLLSNTSISNSTLYVLIHQMSCVIWSFRSPGKVVVLFSAVDWRWIRELNKIGTWNVSGHRETPCSVLALGYSRECIKRSSMRFI